jgi:hypothetical protein
MEENSQNNNQDNKQQYVPIRCPVCGNLELAYVTEYHKCVGTRVAMMLSIILTIISLIDYITRTKESVLISWIIIFSILALILYGIIQYIESKTHVKVICPKCCHQWYI